MRTLHRINCARCKKSFFSYDSTMAYCNTNCEAKHKYEQHFAHHKHRDFTKTDKCKNCGDTVAQYNAYCGHECRKAALKKKRIEATAASPILKKRGKPKPYDVLNEMEEKKRLRSLR